MTWHPVHEDLNEDEQPPARRQLPLPAMLWATGSIGTAAWWAAQTVWWQALVVAPMYALLLLLAGLLPARFMR